MYVCVYIYSDHHSIQSLDLDKDVFINNQTGVKAWDLIFCFCRAPNIRLKIALSGLYLEQEALRAHSDWSSQVLKSALHSQMFKVRLSTR